MECSKCGAVMVNAQFRTGAHTVPPYLTRKRGKGAFEPEHLCGVDCLFCSACGRIELYAQDPQKLLFP